MAKTPDYFGNFPFKPEEKKPCMITADKMKMFIYTPEMPHSSDLNWLIASTERMTVGKYQLAPGSTFDPVDVHAGDEIYYILKGTIVMLNPKTGQTEEVREGETILLPKEAPHKAYNFTNEEAVILFVIAPKIWESEGPPAGYFEKMNLYKSEG
jgi:mannose-6-phosphate isomerase-like protein (cupin superfamily)